MKKILLMVLMVMAAGLCFAEEKATPELTITEIKDNLYIISGDGGNMAYLHGAEGGVLIDNGYSRTGPGILDAIKKLGDAHPKYVVNTHYHGDHSGSNLTFGKAGSIIVGHRNARARLAAGTEIKAFKMVTPPAEPVALPSITYTDGMDLLINGEAVSLFHVENAHTDGDTILKFVDRNIVHTGDVMFNGFYPFIDVDHGGTLAGYVGAQDSILDLLDDDSIVIPGHGEITDRAGVLANEKMLKTVLERLTEARKAGKSLEQVIADKPLADLDEEWGNGIFTSDRWISLVYKSVTIEEE